MSYSLENPASVSLAASQHTVLSISCKKQISYLEFQWTFECSPLGTSSDLLKHTLILPMMAVVDQQQRLIHSLSSMVAALNGINSSTPNQSTEDSDFLLSLLTRTTDSAENLQQILDCPAVDLGQPVSKKIYQLFISNQIKSIDRKGCPSSSITMGFKRSVKILADLLGASQKAESVTTSSSSSSMRKRKRSGKSDHQSDGNDNNDDDPIIGYLEDVGVDSNSDSNAKVDGNTVLTRVLQVNDLMVDSSISASNSTGEESVDRPQKLPSLSTSQEEEERREKINKKLLQKQEKKEQAQAPGKKKQKVTFL